MSSVPRGVIELGNGFYNCRGSYKIRGLIELGTQCSLVRRSNGEWVFLDTYTLDDATRAWVEEKTGGPDKVSAILNLHPFHTMHTEAMHNQFPSARLYGTDRHIARFADLAWQPERTESEALHALFADDFDFSVPPGVHFVPDNENLHFASVLAIHRASKTLHVDDTLLQVRIPWFLRWWPSLWGTRELTRFHPTLAKVLEERPGAVSAFREWAADLVERCGDVENLVAAHSRVLRPKRDGGPPIKVRVAAAFANVEKTLAAHHAVHG
ncbi:MAG: hypothetical protein AB8I08_03435 [Sandaracinaceae bacterium]